MTMPRDPLQRDRLEDRLHRRALTGDCSAFLRLRRLRRLWRAMDTMNTNRKKTQEKAND